MVQFLIAAVLVLVAVGVAMVIQRRTAPGGPAQGTNWTVPVQLHRPDFTRPDAPWLVVVFSSATCTSCADSWTKAQPLESPEVAVENVPFQEQQVLHDRYHIEAVPTVVVADREGVVRASFLGPIGAADLWNVVADLRANESSMDGSVEPPTGG